MREGFIEVRIDCPSELPEVGVGTVMRHMPVPDIPETLNRVQVRRIGRQELALENQLVWLDRYHLVILDDFATVRKDQAETSVLFELISVRYERYSLMITANQPFEDLGKIFPDEITVVAPPAVWFIGYRSWR